MMPSNRSAYFDNTFALVRVGYEDYAPDLIKSVILSLKRDDLNDSQREYLIHCLQRLLEFAGTKEDGKKAFFLISGRGRKKKATAMRDLHAATLVIFWHKKGMILPDAYAKTQKALSKMFPEAPIDVEAVRRAYEKNYKKILKNWDEIEPALIGRLE